MKNLRILLLLFGIAFPCLSICGQIINGDLNHNDELDVEDVTILINRYIKNNPETIITSADPFYTNNSLVIGTWYKSEDESFTLNADSTTDYIPGATYKFKPYQGCILFYNKNNIPIYSLRVSEVTTNYLAILPAGSDIPVVYTSTPQRGRGYENGHEWIDLGISVKWATMNIGASSPEDYGDLFAWGEVNGYNSGKTTFNWNTYKWCDNTETALTKYNYDTNYGKIDTPQPLYELLPEDDAAHMNWGENWRMPSFNPDVWELMSKCTWTKTVLNGVIGYNVTGPNGNSIFFPTSGWIHDDSFGGIGRGGDYWSRTLNPNDPTYAYGFWFFDEGLGWATRFPRDFGRRIRPVIK